jgi:hypothetical protein
MERIVQDPFVLQPRVSHAALAEGHETLFDTYEPLFDDFFQSDEFRYWSSGQNDWQLHCHGGPGCGKVSAIYPSIQRTISPSSTSVDQAYLYTTTASPSWRAIEALTIAYKIADYPSCIRYATSSPHSPGGPLPSCVYLCSFECNNMSCELCGRSSGQHLQPVGS